MIHRIHCLPDHSMRSLRLVLVAFAFAMPSATSAEELGRLFFTPERRQQLDHQRQFNLEEQRGAPEAPTLTINGVVTRSSGQRTVWVDGVPHKASEVTNGIIVEPQKENPGRVAVQTGDISAEDIGVGGSISRNTGETTDVIGTGHIRTHRKAMGR